MASFLAGRAEQFIDQNSDRPFILCVSTFEPHSPYDGPFDDQYDPDQLPIGPAFLTRPEGAALANRVRADYFMQYLRAGDIGEDAYMRETLVPGPRPVQRGGMAKTAGTVLRERNARRPDGRKDYGRPRARRRCRRHGGCLHHGSRRNAGRSRDAGEAVLLRGGVARTPADEGGRGFHPGGSGWMAA